MAETFSKDEFIISASKTKLDLSLVHNFLTNSYWSKDISFEVVKKLIKNSLCFGIYNKTEQVGFARVVTDTVSFAYILDLFVVENYGRKGLSKWLMQTILSYPDLKDVRKWVLATRDAQSLYSKFGFRELSNPEKYMELIIKKD